MDDKYTFRHWVSHHGYSQGSGDFIEVSKKAVWDAVKHDQEFLKLKLFEIKVEQPAIGYTYTGWPTGIATPLKTYQTSKYWCKGITEARKIGEVIRQLYPVSDLVVKSVNANTDLSNPPSDPKRKANT